MAKDKTKAKESRAIKFFKGVKAEFKKIIWPTREALVKETTAVVVISVILGFIIALLDWVIQFGLGFIIK